MGGALLNSGVVFRKVSLGHKLSPIRYEPYHHRSGRTFQRPHAMAPFVSATIVSIRATCPDDCPLRDGGCYAQGGFHGPVVRALDTTTLPGVAVIHEEAEAIRTAFPRGVPQDGARGGRDLRLHLAGDVPSKGAARAAADLADAAASWRARGGGAVFTYTHQWHRAPRSAWGGISVLASCDHPYEVALARRRGYAAALVVASFPSERAFEIPGVPGKVVPCPAQTRGATCAECRLCLDRDLVALDVTIGFAAHGRHPTIAADGKWRPAALRVVQG